MKKHKKHTVILNENRKTKSLFSRNRNEDKTTRLSLHKKYEKAYPEDLKKKARPLFLKLKINFDTFCQEKKFKPEIKKVLANIEEYLDYLDKYHYLSSIFKWREELNSYGCDPLKILETLASTFLDISSLSKNDITCSCEIPGCSYEMDAHKKDKILSIIRSVRDLEAKKERFDLLNNNSNYRIDLREKMKYLVDVIYTNANLDYLAKYLFLLAVIAVAENHNFVFAENHNFLECQVDFIDILETISTDFQNIGMVQVWLKSYYIREIQKEIGIIRVGVNNITFKNIENITFGYSREHISKYVPADVNKIIGNYTNFFNRKPNLGSKVGHSFGPGSKNGNSKLQMS